MSLSKTKAWVAGAVVMCLLMTVAAWFLLISPQRAAAAETRDKTVAAEALNRSLEIKLKELQAQFAELPQRQAELAAIQQAMPEDAQMPTLVRAIDTKAVGAGVTLMSVTPGTPLAVITAAAPAPAAEPADPAGDAAAETTTPSPAGGLGAAPAPVPGATSATGELVAIPVVVTVVGNFYNTEVFLKSVQTELSRDYLVQGLNLKAEEPAEASDGKPAVKNGDVTMIVTGSVFVLRTGDALAGTTDPTSTDSTSTDS